jgi:hypothetical protein
MAALSIIQRLPDPSTLNPVFESVLSDFNDVYDKVKDFSPADLAALLEAGGNLPIPNSLALIEDTLDNFSNMAQRIPSDPQALTASLLEELRKLKEDMMDLSEILGPITTVVDSVTPMLERFDTLNDVITRVNNILADLPGISQGLNLANLAEQFEYFSRLFDLFPELSNISPFTELKAQIDTLKAWLTLNTNELSEYFRSQMQTIADALPVQLNEVVQEGLDMILAIEAPLQGLERNIWYTPYNQALDALEAIDLNDLSQISDYLALVSGKVAELTAISDNLIHNAHDALEALNAWSVNLFSQNLRHAFMSIVYTISPEAPGILAVIFKKIRKMINSIEIQAVRTEIEKVAIQIEGLFGNIEISEAADKIKEVTDRIVSGVEVVDQALVKVATTLSNLVAELESIIADVDLSALTNAVDSGLGALTAAVDELLPKVDSVGQEIDALAATAKQDVQELDLVPVKNAINTLLTEITAILDDPQIRKILDEAQEGVEEIAENLKSVTLKPIFERVETEINDLKSKLATVDVSELNDFLKAALKTALDIIREIDFAEDVADKLTERFQAILDQSVDLVEPLHDKYLEAVARIEQFNPGSMVSDKLTPTFETLVEELNKIQPSKIAEPLKKLHDSLVGLLEPLEPNALLKPLLDLHGEVVGALQSLSPHDLIAPLNELLSEITNMLNELKIEEVLTQVTDSVNKVNTLITNFSLGDQIRNTDFWETLEQVDIQGKNLLQGVENNVDVFLDEMTNTVAAVDISTLQPAFDALSAAIDSIENHVNSPAVLTQMTDISLLLNTQNFAAGTTDLTQRWLAQKARFEGFVPPPEFASDYETLKQKVQELSPIELLAAPATLVNQMEARIETANTALMQIKESLVYLLQENQDKLNALLPDEFTSDGFKRLLREALDEQLGKPFKQLLQLIRKRCEEFTGALQTIKAIGMKFRIPYEALTIIPNSIGTISNALLTAKDKITGINLNFLEDELQAVIDEAVNKLSEDVSPGKIIPDLEKIHLDTLTALDPLYPETQIQGLDTLYKEEVIGKIAKLHPDITVAAPLNSEYLKILQLEDNFNVDGIFDALNGELTSIDHELEEGLQRTGTAFNSLLAALPL